MEVLQKRKKQLLTNKNYLHFDLDIRNKKRIDEIFSKYKSKIDLYCTLCRTALA